ncbi:MAG TPA: ACT domain-containing protein [Clostridiales bacterium]|nr:ACT domain-containing protein [Clostridiales bacterium]
MKAIVTVIGKDKIGIISNISTILAKYGVNILDISQTILQGYFTMMMFVDLKNMDISFAKLKEELDLLGNKLEVSIIIQQEDVFKAMHRI